MTRLRRWLAPLFADLAVAICDEQDRRQKEREAMLTAWQRRPVGVDPEQFRADWTRKHTADRVSRKLPRAARSGR